jgi:uracil-DNA glycosylase family 4
MPAGLLWLRIEFYLAEKTAVRSRAAVFNLLRKADSLAIIAAMESSNPQNTTLSLQALETDLILCHKCPRLVAWREQVAAAKRKAYQGCEYWGKPVPGFGDSNARLLIVGLAPGAHGSNRTGQMFTGDASGDFLYPALFRAGFANRPMTAACGDGLELRDVFISAICRCAPPQNKPTTEEMRNCLPWLAAEMACLPNLRGIVVLGQGAFDGVLALPAFLSVKKKELTFGHGAFYELGDGLPWLLCSYHPSRQNTQTGRLTKEMFDQIWKKVNDLLA